MPEDFSVKSPGLKSQNVLFALLFLRALIIINMMKNKVFYIKFQGEIATDAARLAQTDKTPESASSAFLTFINN